jgi:hypothetical protein
MDAAQLQGITQYKPGNASSDLEARAIGCMMGAMCGNALGAPVQNDRHWQVSEHTPCPCLFTACIIQACRPRRGPVVPVQS